jgi:uncharacterized protein YjbI with pentapeptide repeats
MIEFIKENKTGIARISFILIFSGIAILALHLSFAYEEDQWLITNSSFGRFLAHTLINIAPELAGIVIGVVTIDYLNERRQEEQLKRNLIIQMGSKRRDVTDTAIRHLRASGWLYDGSLKGAELGEANLAEADLQEADLKNAKLHDAVLDKADLTNANLDGADLYFASLVNTILINAKLRGAVFHGAVLEGGWLQDADLRKACLYDSKLKNAVLSRAKLQGACLEIADLENANLIGVDLTGANLRGANLKNAQFWEGYEEHPFIHRAVMEGIVSTEEVNSTSLWHLYPEEAWERAKRNLLQAENLQFATMPDGRKYEEWALVLKS